MDKIITTSWDDGHPLDFRIAALLEKYHLKGTFYIPRCGTGHAIMSEAEIAVLGRDFEIGGHTLHHVNLRREDHNKQREEIEGCYQWLGDLTGRSPRSFCPPFGAINQLAKSIVSKAGFQTIRTTELLSTRIHPDCQSTTLQLYPHSALTYAKHLLIRRRFPELQFWLATGQLTDILALTDLYLDVVERKGGCFHLWGHSWEIEKLNLWGRLESVIQHLSQRSGYQYLENGEMAPIV
ncbi:MAG TPA: polysaccharide deacetylase family protein [Mucilaginibacter sp.]